MLCTVTSIGAQAVRVTFFGKAKQTGSAFWGFQEFLFFRAFGSFDNPYSSANRALAKYQAVCGLLRLHQAPLSAAP